jgi:hypothetical protein
MSLLSKGLLFKTIVRKGSLLLKTIVRKGNPNPIGCIVFRRDSIDLEYMKSIRPKQWGNKILDHIEYRTHVHEYQHENGIDLPFDCNKYLQFRRHKLGTVERHRVLIVVDQIHYLAHYHTNPM